MPKKPIFKIAVNPFFFVFIFAILSVNCSSIDHNIKQIPKNHILMFNSKGNPVDPCTFAAIPVQNPEAPVSGDDPNNCKEVQRAVLLKDYKQQNAKEFNIHLEKIFKGMDEYFKTQKQKKVLFYVHGGLNSRSGSLERVVDDHWEEPSDKEEEKLLYKKIMASGYYPIFINWHSGLFSTYGDHLFNIRQGEDTAWGLLTSPVVLGIDIARSIARAPLVISSFLTNDIKTIPDIEKYFDTTPSEIADNISKKPISKKPISDSKDCDKTETSNKEGKINVYRGDDCRTFGEQTKYGLTYWATLLFLKVPAAPFIDGFGTSSWANMLRRVQLLYNSDREYHSYTHDNHPPKEEDKLYKPDPMPNEYHDIPISGGMSRFMQKFIEKYRNDMDQKDSNGNDQEEMQITLVGHSTGTNVLNELIRNFGVTEEKNRKEPLILPIENIVYMAAACTVSHFQNTVNPYLLQNDKTNFYNLTLGRKAEIRDEYYYVTPRGSLLVWIDNFLTNPLTHRDRTLGRFDNFMLTAHEIPYSIRNRIHLKTYSTGTNKHVSNTNPQHHGDFGEKIKFWEKRCWKETSEFCYRK